MGNPVNTYCIFDTQHRPGLLRNPLKVIAYDIINSIEPDGRGGYAPHFVVHHGDGFDLPSLSSYDTAKRSFQKECYIADIESGNQALREFWEIIKIGLNRHPGWKPKFIYLFGNHEDRITRARETGPSQYVSIFDIVKPDFTNWHTVMPFLEPYIINGVHHAHFFCNEFNAKAIGTAKMILNKRHVSAVAGHKQFLDIAESPRGEGRIMAIICGSSYYAENNCDNYRTVQNKTHFRGTAYLRNVLDGQWEAEFRNLSTMDKKYG